MPLIGEAYRYPVSGERPQFFDESTAQLLEPFTREEFSDFASSSDELGSPGLKSGTTQIIGRILDNPKSSADIEFCRERLFSRERISFRDAACIQKQVRNRKLWRS